MSVTKANLRRKSGREGAQEDEDEDDDDGSAPPQPLCMRMNAAQQA